MEIPEPDGPEIRWTWRTGMMRSMRNAGAMAEAAAVASDIKEPFRERDWEPGVSGLFGSGGELPTRPPEPRK